jgi:hypothetical protein
MSEETKSRAQKRAEERQNKKANKDKDAGKSQDQLEAERELIRNHRGRSFFFSVSLYSSTPSRYNAPPSWPLS